MQMFGDKMKRSPDYVKSHVDDGYRETENSTTYSRNVHVSGNNEDKVAEISGRLTR